MSVSEDLKFLCASPSVACRAVLRKGELRYVAGGRRGSLAAVARFAPPSKRIPRQVMQWAGRVDFRIPAALGGAVPVRIAEVFLQQASATLGIPADRIGIYVGEPNDRRKLVVMDSAGESGFILKIAAGREAEQAIASEAAGLAGALREARWKDRVPLGRRVDPVAGRTAMLIERIKGRQLTPEEFQQEFFEPSRMSPTLGGRDGVAIGDWLAQNLKPDESPHLQDLFAACRETGALSFRSPLGLVHGDFAPWNLIRREDGFSLCAVDWEFSRSGTPLIFDCAYAAWCYSELLGRRSSRMDDALWRQLVSLGALWGTLREKLPAEWSLQSDPAASE